MPIRNNSLVTLVLDTSDTDTDTDSEEEYRKRKKKRRDGKLADFLRISLFIFHYWPLFVIKVSYYYVSFSLSAQTANQTGSFWHSL